MTYTKPSKPDFNTLSPDLQYKLYERFHKKSGFARFCKKFSWVVTIAVCLPGVLFTAVKPVNDLVTTSYQVASFFKNITQPPGNVSVTLQSLSDEQKQVAQDIIAVGRAKGATDKDIETALSVSMQESGLRNLTYGDNWFFQQNSAALGSSVSDSAGAFQIRRINVDADCQKSVKCSAEWYFDGLLKIDPETRRNKENWELGAMVQRPAKEYERHYSSWNKQSEDIMKNSTGNSQPFNFLASLPISLPGGDTYKHPVNDPITSKFGMRLHPIKGVMKHHDGIDYGTPMGTPIKAIADGKVVVSENVSDGYGLKILIEHPNNGNNQSLYAHLDRSLVTVGDKVRKGDIIGESGNTGSSTAPHLHFGIYQNGSAIDPESVIK